MSDNAPTARQRIGGKKNFPKGVNEMALNQKKNGKWVYDRWFGRYRRVKLTLPAFVKTREQAEEYVPLIPPEKFKGLQLKFKQPIRTIFNNAVTYYQNMHDIDFHDSIEPFLEYCIANEIRTAEIIHLTPAVVEKYSQYRRASAPVKKHNREIRAVAQLHSYLANQGACAPLDFEIGEFLIKAKKEHDVLFSEKFFELLIEKYPYEFLGGDYRNIKAPVRLKGLFPDTFLEDANGNYWVLEIQKGRLDRNHTYKILDYRDKMENELRKTTVTAKVRMMVVLIGDQCLPDREIFLQKYGVKFIKLPMKQVEKIILKILADRKSSTPNDSILPIYLEGGSTHSLGILENFPVMPL